jgi:hypothetical protein
MPFEARFSRRSLLLGTAAAVGCARRRGRGFPGYAFIANAGARTVSAVDLNAFVLAKKIGMDAAPSMILPRCRKAAQCAKSTPPNSPSPVPQSR